MKRTVRTRRSNLASYIVRRCAFRPLRSIPSKDPFLPRCTPFQRHLRRRFCLAWRQSVRFFVLVDSCRCSVGTPTSHFLPSTRRVPAPVRVAFHEVRRGAFARRVGTTCVGSRVSVPVDVSMRKDRGRCSRPASRRRRRLSAGPPRVSVRSGGDRLRARRVAFVRAPSRGSLSWRVSRLSF